MQWIVHTIAILPYSKSISFEIDCVNDGDLADLVLVLFQGIQHVQVLRTSMRSGVVS